MATTGPLSAESYQSMERAASARATSPLSPPGPGDTRSPSPPKSKSRGKFWSSKRTDATAESPKNAHVPSPNEQPEISTVMRSPEISPGPEIVAAPQVHPQNGHDHGKSFESSRNHFGTPTAESYGSMKAYKVYKRRFVGLFVLALLNGITAANAVLFTTITSQSSKFFAISVTRVNWLSNMFAVMYLILGWLVPSLVQTCAIQGICAMAAVAMTLGAWLRYAASCVPDIQSDDYIMPPYLLLFVGSMLIGVAQPMLQTIGPSYSELFFTPRARLAATMFIAISNPLGQAITDLVVPKIVPEVSNHREIRLLLLIIAIVTMIFSFTVFFIQSHPPTPPSMTCELPRLSAGASWRVLFGRSQKSTAESEEEKSERALSRRATVTVVRRNSALQFELERPNTFNSETEDDHSVSYESLGKLSKKSRVDLALLTILFAVIVGAFTAYTTLINQIYIPYGFDSTQAGLFVASLIFPGVIAATVLLPIMGRFCPKTCVQMVKIFGPLIGLAYAGLIWIVKGRDMGGIHLTNILIGVFSFLTIPIVLELAADVTYTAMRPEFSSALLYTTANGVSLLFSVIMEGLQGSNDGPTPREMSRSLIFQGGAVLLASLTIIGLQGRQRRPDLKTRRRSRRAVA